MTNVESTCKDQFEQVVQKQIGPRGEPSVLNFS
jgi:hypothetical protein